MKYYLSINNGNLAEMAHIWLLIVSSDAGYYYEFRSELLCIRLFDETKVTRLSIEYNLVDIFQWSL